MRPSRTTILSQRIQWLIWERNRGRERGGGEKFMNAKVNFSRKRLSRWVTIANSDSRRDTPNGDSLLLFFIWRYDLPDKRPWPYRKSRRLSDRTKRRKAVDQAGRKRSAHGQEERREKPRLTHDFWLCLRPPGNWIRRFSPVRGLSRKS